MTAGDALGALVNAVPRGVPVAVLVDEYDLAITQDVSKGRWAAAGSGIEALRSLAMATKSPDTGARIERCIVTGVARFAHASLFSGANNFADLTSSPQLSRVLGWSESEIRTTFPEELQLLGCSGGADGAVAALAHWYSGYCFDGISASFSPFPVLLALKSGTIATKEMAAASGTNWLGLSPVGVLQRLEKEMQQQPGASARSSVDRPSPSSYLDNVDIANLEAQTVAVVPLLLQTGLLSAIPERTDECRPPNEHARQSLQRMLATATNSNVASMPLFTAALQRRDRSAFSAVLHLVFADLQLKTLLPHCEASYRSALFCALRWSTPPGVMIRTEAAQRSGASDILVEFSGATGVDCVWMLKFAIDTPPADGKMMQSLRYAENLGEEVAVLCCALSVAEQPPLSATALERQAKAGSLSVKWEQRVKTGPAPKWELLGP